MKKLFLLIALSILPAFAQQEMSLGMQPASGSVANLALSASASGGYSQAWLAQCFIPSHTTTFTDAWIYASAATASIGTNDLVADFYSTTAASPPLPNASISTTTTVAATPTGAAWVHFTGLSAALTAGTQYCLVLRNANASPTTIYPTYQWAGAGSTNVYAGGSSSVAPGWYKINSANGGSTWAGTFAFQVSGWLISGGTVYEGLPVSATQINSTTKVFGTESAGYTFTTGGATFNSTGAVLWFRKVGSPPNSVTISLMSGSSGTLTTVASASYSALAISSSVLAPIPAHWPSVTLAANTQYRVVLSTSGGDSSDYYQYGEESTLLNLAGARAILPFGGFYDTVCASSCTTASNWTTTNTTIGWGAILLNPGSEFSTQGGATGSASYPIGGGQ